MKAPANSELKPCPFCGGKGNVQIHRFHELSNTFGVACLDCRAETRQFYGTYDDAVIAWNMRSNWDMRSNTNVEWIDAQERTPIVGDNVIVSIKDESGDTSFDFISVGWYSGIDNKWVVDNEFNNYVTHWREFPRPFKKREG